MNVVIVRFVTSAVRLVLVDDPQGVMGLSPKHPYIRDLLFTTNRAYGVLRHGRCTTLTCAYVGGLTCPYRCRPRMGGRREESTMASTTATSEPLPGSPIDQHLRLLISLGYPRDRYQGKHRRQA